MNVCEKELTLRQATALEEGQMLPLREVRRERKRVGDVDLRASTHVMAIMMITGVTNKRERGWNLARREEDPGQASQEPMRGTEEEKLARLSDRMCGACKARR